MDVNCLTVLRAKPNFLSSFLALRKRAVRSENPSFSFSEANEERLSSLLQEGKVLLAKGPYDILGSLILTHQIGDLFPEKRSEKEINDFLFSIGYQGQNIAVILEFFAEPSIRVTPVLEALFGSVLSSEKDSDIFARVSLDNVEAMRFLAKRGFLASKPVEGPSGIDPYRLFYRKKKKEGICSEGNW